MGSEMCIRDRGRRDFTTCFGFACLAVNDCDWAGLRFAGLFGDDLVFDSQGRAVFDSGDAGWRAA